MLNVHFEIFGMFPLANQELNCSHWAVVSVLGLAHWFVTFGYLASALHWALVGPHKPYVTLDWYLPYSWERETYAGKYINKLKQGIDDSQAAIVWHPGSAMVTETAW